MENYNTNQEEEKEQSDRDEVMMERRNLSIPLRMEELSQKNRRRWVFIGKQGEERVPMPETSRGWLGPSDIAVMKHGM